VAGTGFNAPRATFETMMELRDFNVRRVPYFQAWGVFAFLGDVAIWVASKLPIFISSSGNEDGLLVRTYYLLKVKGSLLYRQRKVLGKLQTILLGILYASSRLLFVCKKI
jgi:hypothetical protein